MKHCRGGRHHNKRHHGGCLRSLKGSIAGGALQLDMYRVRHYEESFEMGDILKGGELEKFQNVCQMWG